MTRRVYAPQPAPSLGEISVSALDSVTAPRHRWYFLKEAFSPEIVKRALEDADCHPEDVIADPFCGSGTVPVQAALEGHRSSGVEVNPFLAFVARTKLLQCRSTALESQVEAAVKGARRGKKSKLIGFSTFTKRRGLSKWLFNDEVLHAFEGAWNAVNGSSTPAQQLAKLCLIGAAMDACNAFKDGKCLRYRSDWEERDLGQADFLSAFEARVKIVTEDLKIAPLPHVNAAIQRGDSRRRDIGRSFRLCVTSPPYLNSFDYTDVYRPELFLGKWVRDMAELRALRFRTVRSHVQVEWKDPVADDFGSHYAESIAALRPHAKTLWNGRIPRMIQAYFEDMRNVLKGLRKRAADDASVWIVVSTSAYAGVEIPVDLIFADIAATENWYLREVSVLRYLGRVSGQQWSDLAEKKTRGPHLRESLIILDAKPRANGKTIGATKGSAAASDTLH